MSDTKSHVLKVRITHEMREQIEKACAPGVTVSDIARLAIEKYLAKTQPEPAPEPEKES
jgi:methionine aminopeptidase